MSIHKNTYRSARFEIWMKDEGIVLAPVGAGYQDQKFIPYGEATDRLDADLDVLAGAFTDFENGNKLDEDGFKSAVDQHLISEYFRWMR